MTARAQQDREIEERQKHSLVPAVHEVPATIGKYVIEEFNASTGETRTRQITPLPQPTRFQAKQITKDELNAMIVELRQEMATQQERFDHKDSIDKANTDKRQELYNTISELSQQLNAAKGELDQLNRVGSVRDEFIAFAARAEQRITSIATGVYNFLLEKTSNDRHEARLQRTYSAIEGGRSIQSRSLRHPWPYTGEFLLDYMQHRRSRFPTPGSKRLLRRSTQRPRP